MATWQCKSCGKINVFAGDLSNTPVENTHCVHCFIKKVVEITEQEMLSCIEASKLTPEEFGELLATAENPVNLCSETQRFERHTARCELLKLPYGRKLLGLEM